MERGLLRWRGMSLDLRTSLRSLRRSPGFAVAAVLTLGLALGAVTTAFGLLSGSLDDGRFGERTQLTLALTEDVAGQRVRMRWPYAAIRLLREAAPSSLSRIASYTTGTLNVTGANEAARLDAELVSDGYFAIARAAAAHGRLPAVPTSEAAGAPAEIVISDRLWHRAFAASADAIGRTIRVSRVPLTVVGVLPPGFAGLSGRADIWLAHAWAPTVSFPGYFTSPEYFHNVIAELAPAATLAQARSELAAIGDRIAQNVAARSDDAVARGVDVRTLGEARTDPATVRARIYVVAGALLVLLVAAVNLANLVAARLAVRRRELVVRLAVGASRGRVFRAVLMELLIVATGGLVAAVIFGLWTRDAIAMLIPADVATPANDYAQMVSRGGGRLDLPVLLVTGAAALGVTLLAAALAVVPILRSDIAASLRRAGDRGASLAPARPQRLLLAAQIAASLTLVAVAGLLLRSVTALGAIDPGVATDGVLVFSVAEDLETVAADRFDVGPSLVERLVTRVSAVPGVQAVTAAQCPPFGARCARLGLTIVGQPETGSSPPTVGWHRVGPDHFATLGIPVRRGRGFTAFDRRGRPPVVVVNEVAAERFFPGQDPIGRRVRVPEAAPGDPAEAEIVGVVGNVRYWPLDEPPGPDVYQPAFQFSHPWTTVLARVAGEPLAFVGAMRAAVADVDPALPIFDVAPLDSLAAAGRADRRLISTLIGMCALLALVLGAVRTYGLTAAWLEGRRRELGVRAALGADPGMLVRAVMGDTLRQCAIGLAAGVSLAVLSGHLLRALLFGVAPHDPLSLTGAVLLLAAVTTVVAYVPARRAQRIDPIRELNSE